MMQSILIVDDNKENQSALAAVLHHSDIEILVSNNGHEALRLLLKHDVALALIDMQMPVMGGFEMAELMRGCALGAVDHLARPFQDEVLRAKIKVFLDIDRQRRELTRHLKEARRRTDQNEPLLHDKSD